MTTRMVMRTLIVSIKISVPRMVKIPVTNWVNACRKPSEMISISETALPIRSPLACPSMYRSGTCCKWLNRSHRRSRMVCAARRLVQRDMSHWNRALTAMVSARTMMIFHSCGKSTSCTATTQSTALPIRIGTNRESPVPINAKTAFPAVPCGTAWYTIKFAE